jgi:hypothetical protein
VTAVLAWFVVPATTGNWTRLAVASGAAAMCVAIALWRRRRR